MFQKTTKTLRKSYLGRFLQPFSPRVTCVITCASALSVSGELCAGEKSSKSVIPVEPSAHSKWTWGIGVAPLHNVDVRFSRLGSFTSPLTPQPLGGGQNYTYENGFVHVDSSGNAGDLTWNWGYDNNAQYDPSGGGFINLSISSSLQNASLRKSEDFSHGFEIFAAYEIGELTCLKLPAGNARWGIKTLFHYSNVKASSGHTLSSGVSRLTDSFALNGVIPPLAPYSGSFNGPGPLLGDDPARNTALVPDAAVVTGRRDFDVHVFGLGVGPYLEIPVSKKLSVGTAAGLNLAIATGNYSFDSTTTIAGAGSQSSSDSGSGTNLLLGAFAELSTVYQINDDWGVYGSARYQYYQDFDVSASGSEAELSFSNSFILSLGVTYSF